jgi:hypothetical protein
MMSGMTWKKMKLMKWDEQVQDSLKWKDIVEKAKTLSELQRHRRRRLHSIHGGRMYVTYTALVEWYWQEKTEILGEKKTDPVSLCPPQTPHKWASGQIRFTAVRSRRLTSSSMARPSVNKSKLFTANRLKCGQRCSRTHKSSPKMLLSNLNYNAKLWLLAHRSEM